MLEGWRVGGLCRLRLSVVYGLLGLDCGKQHRGPILFGWKRFVAQLKISISVPKRASAGEMQHEWCDVQ